MQYITKVDDFHIIEVSGKNIKVEDNGTSFFYKRMQFRRCPLDINVPNFTTISEIVLFVEVCKFIMEKTDEQNTCKNNS